MKVNFSDVLKVVNEFGKTYSEDKGCVIWLTGLPCSGKTTITNVLAGILEIRGMQVERLDGDIVRKGLTNDLGFSKEDRAKNLERVAFVAKLLSRNNVITICSFVSPYEEVRQRIKREVTNFIEVFVDCPIRVCEIRDVKGMYKLAREGKIKNFTGVDDPYEIPSRPDLILFTNKETVDESVGKILKYLEGISYNG